MKGRDLPRPLSSFIHLISFIAYVDRDGLSAFCCRLCGVAVAWPCFGLLSDSGAGQQGIAEVQSRPEPVFAPDWVVD